MSKNYYCKFCSNELDKDIVYLDCKECNVSFTYDLKYSVFEATIDDDMYDLLVGPNVTQLKLIESHMITSILNLNHELQNVTPENVKEKIKILLLLL